MASPDPNPISVAAPGTSATGSMPLQFITLPPRKFNPKEYAEYKNLPGMPQNIPNVTATHYACMIVPLVILLVLYIHHRDASAKDIADERSKTKIIKFLLGLGMFFATLIAMVHLQLIPVRYVRKVFPRWRQPPPMSKFMKTIILFCLLAFVIYPTAKFIRKRGLPVKGPQVHRLVAS